MHTPRCLPTDAALLTVFLPGAREQRTFVSIQNPQPMVSFDFGAIARNEALVVSPAFMYGGWCVVAFQRPGEEEQSLAVGPLPLRILVAENFTNVQIRFPVGQGVVTAWLESPRDFEPEPCR